MQPFLSFTEGVGIFLNTKGKTADQDHFLKVRTNLEILKSKTTKQTKKDMQVFQAENNLKLQNEEKSFSLFQNCLIYGLVRGHGSCKMISIPTEMWV